MVLAVTVILTVGFVMFVVIRHEVHQRKAIVGRNEIHAGLDASFL